MPPNHIHPETLSVSGNSYAFGTRKAVYWVLGLSMCLSTSMVFSSFTLTRFHQNHPWGSQFAPEMTESNSPTLVAQDNPTSTTSSNRDGKVALLRFDPTHDDTPLLRSTLWSILENTSSEWQIQLAIVGSSPPSFPHSLQQVQSLVETFGRSLHLMYITNSIDNNDESTNVRVWRQVRGEHVWFVPLDSVVCQPTIDSFLKYNLVDPTTTTTATTTSGSYYPWDVFSLHRRSRLEQCAERHDQQHNDDFVQCVQQQSKDDIPHNASVTQTFLGRPDSLGIQKGFIEWNKNSSQQQSEACEHCPAVRSLLSDTNITCPDATLPEKVVLWKCHSKDGQSGTFKQFRYAFESLYYAIQNGWKWQPSLLGASIHVGCAVPFQSIVDLYQLRVTFPDTVISDRLPTTQQFIPCINGIRCASEEPDPTLWSKVISTVQPAEPIRSMVDKVLGTVPGRFVCLHARVEKDFEALYNGTVRHKSVDQIRNMMAKHDFDSTIDALYVAGGNVNTTRWSGIGFPRVLSKNIVPKNMLDGSLVDQEVCKHADVHVGNSGSIWDEWLHEWRFFHNKSTLMYAGDQWVTSLKPFKGRGDPGHLFGMKKVSGR